MLHPCTTQTRKLHPSHSIDLDMSSSNSSEDNHQDQEDPTQLHPDDLGQLEDAEAQLDRGVGEGSSRKSKTLKMHHHTLPIQFPTTLSTNHFDNLI